MQRPPRNWQVLEVGQRYTVGKDGMPVRLVTDSLIRALEPLERTQYVFDTNELRVEGICGCTAGPVVPDEYKPDKYWAVNLSLNTPISKGETAALLYCTRFHYSSPPPNILAQSGAAYGIESLNLVVQFHPAKLPVKAWWEQRDQANEVVESGLLKLAPITPESGAQGSYISREMTNLPPRHQLLVQWEW